MTDLATQAANQFHAATEAERWRNVAQAALKSLTSGCIFEAAKILRDAFSPPRMLKPTRTIDVSWNHAWIADIVITYLITIEVDPGERTTADYPGSPPALSVGHVTAIAVNRRTPDDVRIYYRPLTTRERWCLSVMFRNQIDEESQLEEAILAKAAERLADEAKGAA